MVLLCDVSPLLGGEGGGYTAVARILAVNNSIESCWRLEMMA